MPANRYKWDHLNRIQIGNYAEYLVKMEFVLHGGDVFISEVDDHGIDLVLRTPAGIHYDIQIKSVYRANTGYVYIYRTHPSLFLALVRFVDGEAPDLYLIPSWLPERPNPIFKECRYTERGKPAFEMGLALNKTNLATLAKDYRFGEVMGRLIAPIRPAGPT